MKKSLAYLQKKKARGEKIAVLTAYDCPTARLEDAAGVDIVLVGDSVGTNVLGYESAREVTMADMVHHLKAVRRGVERAYLLADMPCGSFDTVDLALTNAQTFRAHGADGVKIEGATPALVTRLSEAGIEVCAHLGLLPQTDESPGFRAKTAAAAITLVQNALALEPAGAALFLFETIPEEVAGYLTARLAAPTIGIGAGRRTDGQVLVIVDVLGLSGFDFRHNRKYDDLRDRTARALARYVHDVETGAFPAEDNLRHMDPAELAAFRAALAGTAVPQGR